CVNRQEVPPRDPPLRRKRDRNLKVAGDCSEPYAEPRGVHMATEAKITYATLTADNQELNAKFDAAIVQVRGALGRTCPLYINGKARPTQSTTDSLSPADTRTVVARVASGTVEDVGDAVAAAKAAYPGWRHTPWQKRNEILARAAKTIRDRRFELSAWLIYEMGKNRIEALGEIEETADLIDYYIEQMRA